MSYIRLGVRQKTVYHYYMQFRFDASTSESGANG